jgi:site-specific recombinase XerD
VSNEKKSKPEKKKHPGTFEDRGAYQRLILYVGGERHTFRCDTFDKKASAKFAREKHRELTEKLDKQKKGIDTTVRFSGLLEQYERDELPMLAPGTERSYRDSFVPLREYFVTELGDPTLTDIGTRHVKGFLAWRIGQRRVGKNNKASSEPLSNRTLQKDRAVLHRLLDFAYQLELVEGNPVARVEQPKADPRTPVLLTDDQFEKLLEKCAPNAQLWLYTLTLGETGGRCLSEILHLRWEHVDLAEGFIEVRSEGRRKHRSKSGRSRFVPMTPRLLQAMKDHAARVRFATYHGKQSPWVFHHERDRRGCVAGERVKTMRTAFDTAQKAAGISDSFHRHDLRHRRVTSWLAEGQSATLVREALGHSDLRTTLGYAHLSRVHLKALVAPTQTPASPETAKQA